MLFTLTIANLTKAELVALCREMGVRGYSRLNKPALIQLVAARSVADDTIERQALAIECIKQAGQRQLEILRRAEREIALVVKEQVQAVQELECTNSALRAKTKPELIVLCKQHGIKKYSTLRKKQLVELLHTNGIMA